MKKPLRSVNAAVITAASQTIIAEVVSVSPEATIDETLGKLARDAYQSAAEAMGKYWELVVYIRENQVTPSAVRKALTAAGFADSRVSEVIKVISAPEKVYIEYREKAIGFRLALKRAREEAPKKKKKKQPTEAQIFAVRFVEFMETFVPIKGDIPNFLTEKAYKVNGRDILLAFPMGA